VSGTPKGPPLPEAKQNDWIIRAASVADRRLISSLLAGATWKHQHLDWFSAIDLLGSEPYYLALQRGRPIGCLACPPDVREVAWLRLFVVAAGYSVERMWDRLWDSAEAPARRSGAAQAAALPTTEWMPALLERSGYGKVNEVIFLEWEGTSPPDRRPSPATTRPFQPGDLSRVTEIDHRAFGPLWQLSPSALAAALSQASVATVAEIEGRPAGYQISTASGAAAHLARLAVDPPLQGRGIGALLVSEAIRALLRHRIHRVSVNTQADNQPSRRLYETLGFTPTGQSYPVYALPF
jgi:ribosomal protein S18 acetylase RimI-like enzyme